MRRTLLAALTLVTILSSATGSLWAGTPSGLDATGDTIVPAAWAGVWQVYEETRNCGSTTVISTRSYRDTVCTGDTFYPFTMRYSTCSGGFTDTTFTLNCGTSAPCFCGNCVETWYENTAWTLSGDVATTAGQMTHGRTGGQCRLNDCFVISGTRTRLWPDSNVCGAVPTRRGSWGRLKLLYR